MGKSKEQVKDLSYSIYRVSTALSEIMEMIENNEGEVTDAIYESLEHFMKKQEQNIEQAVLLYHQLNAENDAIDQEISRLKNLKESRNRKINAITNILKKIIPAGKSVLTPLIELKWRKSTQLQVDDFEIDWDELDKLGLVKIVKTVDKVKARQLLKDTQVLPKGLSLIEVDNLIIK